LTDNMSLRGNEQTTHGVLIDGAWRHSAGSEAFSPVNPVTAEPLDGSFPVSPLDELDAAIKAGQDAASELRTAPPETLANFLEAYATAIEGRSDEIVEIASTESALPAEPRLKSVELPRTTGQLRQAAAAVRDRSWRMATIDTETDIRSYLGPLGAPVAVFGPNNFPLAFNSISGGDFAAAIAAGSPVIAKANPAHPTTTKMLAEAALEAMGVAGAPRALVQLVFDMDKDDGLQFVGDRRLGAVAFTGSRAGGLALKAAADSAGVPIYLEMSSVNPMFLLGGALAERGDDIAAEFFGSCTMGVGQFCTNPGLLIVPAGEPSERFVAAASDLFANGPAGVLLSPPTHLRESVDALVNQGATLVAEGQPGDGPGFSFPNHLLQVSGDEFLGDPVTFQTEAFGPAALVVVADDTAQMLEIAERLDGNLTGTIYSAGDGSDDAVYDQVEAVLRPRVGRLLNDKMPTGVAVSPAMQHGGPYPATGHPGFTAVGIPASLRRFTALQSYDGVREHRLPPELRNQNPSGSMWRLIDSEWSQSDLP
jgi:alpha-ketoglutaric semialdehyde dehydrogenase